MNFGEFFVEKKNFFAKKTFVSLCKVFLPVSLTLKASDAFEALKVVVQV
jgi:hypothetical protein